MVLSGPIREGRPSGAGHTVKKQPYRTADRANRDTAGSGFWRHRRANYPRAERRSRQIEDGSGGGFAAQRYQHDFRRDAEPERHDAAAETAGDDEIAISSDVA